jgi:hypothetical protein
MSLQTFFGLAGQALLVAGALAVLLRRTGCKSRALRILPPVAAALSLVPLGHLSSAAYLRGQFGDLSVSSMVLLALAALSFLLGRDLLGERSRKAIHPAVALAALLLYPFALGLTYFDPYGAGYGSHVMLGALAALALAAWFARQHALVAILVLSLAAQLAGVLESGNLWDYLLDPLIAVYAITWCALSLRPRRNPA